MEEKNDEFFCGETTEEPIIQTENAVLDCGQNSRRSRLILKAIREFKEEVSDAKFVELWQKSETLSYAIRFLEEHMGQTIDSYLLNAIHNRVLNLRSKGVQLKRFTI